MVLHSFFGAFLKNWHKCFGTWLACARRFAIGVLVVAGHSHTSQALAQDEGFFQHNYAFSGQQHGEGARIVPKVDAPDKNADQMLQTEAKPENDRRDSAHHASPVPAARPKSYEGRFVNHSAGVESQSVPHELRR